MGAGRLRSGRARRSCAAACASSTAALRERARRSSCGTGRPEDVVPALAARAGRRGGAVDERRLAVRPRARPRGDRGARGGRRRRHAALRHLLRRRLAAAHEGRAPDDRLHAVLARAARAAAPARCSTRRAAAAAARRRSTRERLPAGPDARRRAARAVLRAGRDGRPRGAWTPGSTVRSTRTATGTTTSPAGPSGLSPYLRFGCLSARELEQRAQRPRRRRAPPRSSASSPGATSTPTSCCCIRTTRASSSSRATATSPWDDGRRRCWRPGRAGAPATRSSTPGMRQLAATGWMHNRARMVVGSFLTKDLHLDWRAGEAWFARMLLDGEPAQNNGNWQWIASTGVDPAPYFRRIFNPVAAAGEVRPGRRLRAPLGARAARRPRRAPAAPVDDERGRAARLPAASSAATTRARSSTTPPSGS